MDEEDLLEELIREVQRHNPQTEGWQKALSQLVEYILRSRPICRPFNRQPLFGVYLEIFNLVKQQLFGDVSENLPSYNSGRMNARSWANQLQKDAFKTVLEPTQLQNLALAGQKHPPRSELRRYALGEIFGAIQLSGKLIRPQQNRISPDLYEVIYREAVSRTLLYICRNIDGYDPQRGRFMTWVNYRLDKTFLDCQNELTNQNIEYLAPEDLENTVEHEDSIPLSEVIWQYIEEDPENIFASQHIRNIPEANFRAIALAKFAGQTWQEISIDLEIKIPTLSRFFQRCCEEFRHKFRELS